MNKEKSIDKKNVKALIFDFDGVIHDTYDFHKGKIIEFTKKDLTDEEFKNIHDGNFFDNKENKLKDVPWKDYRHFIHNDMVKQKIDDNIKEAIVKLSKDYKLFIVSSGGEKNISAYLENNGIRNCFKEVLGFESNPNKVDKFKIIFDKYKLSSFDSIFVTDTLGDILEANVVHLNTIAVDYGYHDRERLSKGKPIRIVSSFNAIANIFL